MERVQRELLQAPWIVAEREERTGIPLRMRRASGRRRRRDGTLERGAARYRQAPGTLDGHDLVFVTLEVAPDDSVVTGFLANATGPTTPVIAAVLVLPRFDPDIPLDEFLTIVFDLRAYAAANNITTLLVDVTGNGGGYVCLSA